MITPLEIYLRTNYPATFDDSITGLELMGKVIAKVNEMTTALNGVLATDLQAYVIAKLDIWKNDGTLTDLLDDTFMPRLEAAELELAAAAQFCSPTGGADDTSYLQAIINAHQRVVLRAGTYLIDAETKLAIPSNRTVIFAENAKLQAITNDADSYTVLNLQSVSNVELINPVIVGERATHTGSTGEYGHGLAILSCDNIRVIRPQVSYCWGDGIYINDSTNVRLENVKVDNNRRNGFTLISGENITVDGILASNTNGTAPQAGIDIEPNEAGDELKNIVFRNVKTYNNTSYALLIVLQAIATQSHDIDILVDGHEDDGSVCGFCLSGFRATAPMSGRIQLNNPIYRNSKSTAIILADYYAENTPPLIIDHPVIINPNTANNLVTYPQNCSGLTINRESTYAGTEKMGNIQIINPYILDNRVTKLMKHGIYFQDGKTVGCENVLIVDPLLISGEITYKITEAANVTDGIKVADNLESTARNSTEQYNTIHAEAIRRFTNAGAGQISQINLYAEGYLDQLITFTNLTSYGMTIVPPATCSIDPLSATVGKYITTSQIGASITLRRVSATRYIIESMTGTWTAQS